LARKKAQPEHENHERWLVSYADFITLLFAFFVVMFASSQTDKAKAQQISDSVKEALEKGGVSAAVREIMGGTVDEKGKGNAMMKGPGGSQPKNIREVEAAVQAELVPSLQYLTKALQAEIEHGQVEVHLEPRGLVVSLRQAAFFPSGGDAIDPNTFHSIDKIGATIRELANTVRLEGHTDAVPIHTARFRSNWDLSAARAIAMLEIFADRCGVPAQRLAVAGYADTAPIDSNDTEEGRGHNRRVDIVILAQRVAMKPALSVEPPRAPPVLNKAAQVGPAAPK
jgi:chemotaxis protein MotB